MKFLDVGEVRSRRSKANFVLFDLRLCKNSCENKQKHGEVGVGLTFMDSPTS